MDIQAISGNSLRAFQQSTLPYFELFKEIGISYNLIHYPYNNDFFNIPFNDKVINSKIVIIYRSVINPEFKKKCKENNISVGFTLDDFLFYSDQENKTKWNGYPKYLREIVQKTIIEADFCFTGSEKLTEKLKKYNYNSFCIGNPIYYPEIFSKLGIKEPLLNNSDRFRIGLISGTGHNNITTKLALDLCKINKNFDIIKFNYNSHIFNFGKVKLEDHKYILGSFIDWQNYLHSLKLDMIVAEYEITPLLEFKSNPKFREAAILKIPCIIIDPSDSLYKDDIINGKTGYRFINRKEAIELINYLMCNRDLCKEIGKNAYNHHLKINFKDRGKEIWDKIQKAVSK